MIRGFIFCFEIFHYGFSLRIRLSDAKMINSADGTINKPTKNIYFLFFGVQNHLIFHGSLPGLGNFSPTIFLVSSGIRQVCDGKTAWKKNIEIVGSFNGITTTCKLMTRIFFHNSELIAVCHVYVTQSSLKRPMHSRESWHIERAGISLWFVSVSLRKWSQTRTQGTNNQIIDPIIYYTGEIFGVAFENFVVSW